MRKFVLLFAACLAFHLLGTWTLPLIDRDEPRFAEASREMLQRGDYVVPFFNNSFRFDKPPLTYWFQIASYRVFGVNDFAARFPSCVAAALTAVLLLAWGTRVRDARLGWFAAIIFTTSLQVAIHARAAVADMWLVLFVTGAHWAGYELLRDRLTTHESMCSHGPVGRQFEDITSKNGPQGRGYTIGRRWWWMFYCSLGFAFLAKGPIGWTPLLAIGAMKFFLRDAQLNRRFLFFTGVVFTLAIVAVWGIPALERTHGEFLRVGIGKHVVERSVIAMEGHGGNSIVGYLVSLPFYLVTIFITFAPWSIRLPSLARKLWRNRDPLDNYLIVGAAVIFIIFSLVKTKLPHYVLPAFPLLALLLARRIDSQRFVRRMAVGFVIVAVLVAAATPWIAPIFPSWNLIRQARGDLRRPMEFGAIRYREPSLVWYARKYVDGFMSDLDEQTAPEFMDKAGPRFIVLPTATASALYPILPNEWKSYSTHGLSTVSGKRVELTLLLKPL